MLLAAAWLTIAVLAAIAAWRCQRDIEEARAEMARRVEERRVAARAAAAARHKKFIHGGRAA